MKELLVRGKGFVGNKLLSLSKAHYLPRNTESDRNIIYTAAYGNYYDQLDIPETYRVNLIEPLKFIDAESLIYISSSSVLLPTQTAYSLSKRAMEEFILNSDKPICAIRPSSITGIGEQDKHLIPTLIRSCLYGEEMPFVGEPTHDFIDIEDFCRGVLYISENIEEYKGKILNLSSGISYSNFRVKEMVEELTGKIANTHSVDSMRKYDNKEWVVKPDLNFYEKPLYLSIKEMIEYERTGKESN